MCEYIGISCRYRVGAIASLTTVVQCCSYSIGQAAQPILSENFGARKTDRVRQVLKYGILTAVAFGAFWTTVTMLLPNTVIRIFMDATDSVLAIAPAIMRRYCIGYLFVPFTLFATYYFQSILKPRVSLGISLSRGAYHRRNNAVCPAAYFRCGQHMACNADCGNFRCGGYCGADDKGTESRDNRHRLNLRRKVPRNNRT